MNVGDEEGNVLPATGHNGTVTVVDGPPCEGDCDHDCNVLGNEITVAIQIVAGNQVLDNCSAADSEPDGEVFGHEVTRAINRLANGCEECCVPAP